MTVIVLSVGPEGCKDIMGELKFCYADEVTNRNCKYSVHRGWCENTCKVKMGNCSKCNHEINDKAYFVKIEFDDGCYTYESRAANYCPNCGAKILKE